METGTIPVTVTPEAAERVAELGMQAELQQMLDHTLRTVPNLRSVEVLLALPYDTGDETSITLQALVDHPNPVKDRTELEWDAWQLAAFPPDVCWFFRLMTVYGPPHGR